MEFLCPGKENPHGPLKFDSGSSDTIELMADALMDDIETLMTSMNTLKKIDLLGQLKFDSWLSYKTDLWSALMRERETMKKQYLPDYSKDKSMLVDLKKFKELDAYASKQVDVKDNVKDLVSALLQKAHSDLEKVRAIWIWITHHIAYDTDYYYNNAKTSCEPADILRSGKTICAGYANLFKEMCRCVWWGHGRGPSLCLLPDFGTSSHKTALQEYSARSWQVSPMGKGQKKA
uniref:Kyphoscoliosis peptidase-like isoform X4 n=1 Tax=Pogona vitticeps TaxID=103695 RepID=A0ABM5FIV5_9SAUR